MIDNRIDENRMQDVVFVGDRERGTGRRDEALSREILKTMADLLKNSQFG